MGKKVRAHVNISESALKFANGSSYWKCQHTGNKREFTHEILWDFWAAIL